MSKNYIGKKELGYCVACTEMRQATDGVFCFAHKINDRARQYAWSTLKSLGGLSFHLKKNGIKEKGNKISFSALARNGCPDEIISQCRQAYISFCNDVQEKAEEAVTRIQKPFRIKRRSSENSNDDLDDKEVVIPSRIEVRSRYEAKMVKRFVDFMVSKNAEVTTEENFQDVFVKFNS